MSKQGPVVYVVFPTANYPRATATLEKWRDMGYHCAVHVDEPYGLLREVDININGLVMSYSQPYEGYWASCNKVVSFLMDAMDDNLIVVLAADDMDPDPNKTAREIGREYFERFPDGEGLMQPTGDKQGEIINGKWASQRICGSPWFGRGWYDAGRFNGKPTPENFFHFYGDQLLYDVAKAEGLLWQRQDLKQMHHHWSFERGVEREAYQEKNSREHWKKDQQEYEKAQREWYAKRALEKK